MAKIVICLSASWDKLDREAYLNLLADKLIHPYSGKKFDYSNGELSVQVEHEAFPGWQKAYGFNINTYKVGLRTGSSKRLTWIPMHLVKSVRTTRSIQ